MIASACAFALTAQSTFAQNNNPTAADVQRNIEQNKLDLERLSPKPANKKPLPPATSDQGFARLYAIQVNSPIFQDELKAYWSSNINKPVPAQKLAEFKAFAWELFQAKGYLAYITTSAQPTPNGSILSVNVSMPEIGKVTVTAANGNDGKEFIHEVSRRFEEIYKSGTPVDVQGFENQLSAIAYDLPVDLEVSMRQVNAKVVDVVIYLRPTQQNTGQVIKSLVQVNNYGLSQFGRTQVLANAQISGFTPLSELALTTQQSSGVGYYRADYEAPIIGLAARWKVYASEVRSESREVRGLSNEAGAGLTKLVSTDRAGRWLTGIEASRRETKSWASGLESADRVDNQLRLKLRAESLRGWADSFSNEVTLSSGHMNLDRNSSDKATDADPTQGGYRVAGSYQKIEMNGGLSHVLDKERIYTGSIRWRAQAAAKNLDTYNRFSLGGINGIRAFTSLDGVGDQGAQISFDITHQVVPDVYGSIFYDIGVVKNSHTPLPTATDTGYYTLQGTGWQIGGKIEDVNWSLSVAHAIGKTPGPGVWSSNNTKIGDWRMNMAITKPF